MIIRIIIITIIIMIILSNILAGGSGALAPRPPRVRLCCVLSAFEVLMRGHFLIFGGPGGAASEFFRSTLSFWRSNLLVRGSPGRSGPRFSSPKRVFFRGFSVRQAGDAKKLRMYKNHSFSQVFCMSQASCANTKATQDRSRSLSNTASHEDCTKHSS